MPPLKTECSHPSATRASIAALRGKKLSILFGTHTLHAVETATSARVGGDACRAWARRARPSPTMCRRRISHQRRGREPSEQPAGHVLQQRDDLRPCYAIQLEGAQRVVEPRELLPTVGRWMHCQQKAPSSHRKRAVRYMPRIHCLQTTKAVDVQQSVFVSWQAPRDIVGCS